MKEGFDVQYRMPLEQGLQTLDVGQAVAGALTQRGFYMPPRPMVQTPAGPQPFHGQLPSNLVQLTDDQLGELLGQMGRWQEFIQPELAQAYNMFKQAEAQLEFVEAQLYVSYKLDENGKKRPEPERKALMRADRRLVEAKQRVLYYEAFYRILKGVADGADKNWDTVSRRITQRQQDLERGRREVNVGQGAPMFRRNQ